MPRLVKQLPPAFTDSQLYDLFRPYGALASARTPTQFGPDTGMVEFWNEEDAQMAEEALHCAEVEGLNIAVQLYQPRRASHSVREFNAAAPSFVPAPVTFSPFHAQVNIRVCFAEPNQMLIVYCPVFPTSTYTTLLAGSVTYPDAFFPFYPRSRPESSIGTPKRSRI
jgi:RNA recognition motif-containing protein